MMHKRLYYFVFALLGAMSCESTADIELAESVPTLVVDAFINDKAENQQIVLNFSQPFFDNQQYQPAEGAIISVTDNQGSEPLLFEASDVPGVYVWEPSSERPRIGSVGAEYSLSIEFEGNVFSSTTAMGRTTQVDSILFFEETEPFSDDIIFEGRISARDSVGVGDAYWIKTFWNGAFLDQPSELNIAFDAGLSAGGEIDGQEFIFPVRTGINPQGEDESYEIGDVVMVEIHSIARETFDYFVELQIQTDRPGGFAELFAVPLANLPTNIAVENDPDFRVLGFFSVSSVNSLEVEFTEELIRGLE
ncbi:MAG: DUF4249 family protein [Bacteroidota bacterium]